MAKKIQEIEVVYKAAKALKEVDRLTDALFHQRSALDIVSEAFAKAREHRQFLAEEWMRSVGDISKAESLLLKVTKDSEKVQADHAKRLQDIRDSVNKWLIKSNQKRHQDELTAEKKHSDELTNIQKSYNSWIFNKRQKRQKELDKLDQQNRDKTEKDLQQTQDEAAKQDEKHQKEVTANRRRHQELKRKENQQLNKEVLESTSRLHRAVEKETDKHLSSRQRAIKKQKALQTEIADTMANVERAYRKNAISSKEYNTMMSTLNSSLVDITKNGGKATTHMREIFLGIPQQIKLLKVQLFHTLIGRISMKFTEAFDEARKLQKAVAEIQTIQGEANLTTRDWIASLTSLSNAMGIDVLDLAESAYEALSNQIIEAGDAYLFLTQAANFAKVTNSSMADSVNLLSAVMNAYELSATSAERISAILFKTIDLGRVRAAEIADTIGNLSVLARQAGMSIEEWNTSLQVLTISGVKVNTSMTLMTNVLQKLIRPTEAGKDLFREWGVESGIAAIQTFGFNGVLERLAKLSKEKGVPALGDVAGRVRALRGILGQTSDGNLKKFNDNLDKTSAILGDQSKVLADYRKALEDVKDSLSFKTEQDLTSLKNVLTADFSNVLLDQLQELSEFTGGNLSNSLAVLTDSLLGVYDAFEPFIKLILAGTQVLDYFDGSARATVAGLTTYIAMSKLGTKTLDFFNISVFKGVSLQQMLAMSYGESALAARISSLSTLTLAGAMETAAVAGQSLKAALLGLSVGNAALIGVTALVSAYSYLAANAEKLKTLRADTLNEYQRQDQQYLSTIASTSDTAIAKLDGLMRARVSGFNQYVAAVNAELEKLRMSPKEFEAMNEALDRTKEILWDIDEKDYKDKYIPDEGDIAAIKTVAGDLKAMLGHNNQQMFDRESVERARDTQQVLIDIYSESEKRTLKLLTDLQKAEDKAKGVIESLTQSRQSELFERSLLGKDDEEKERLTIERVNQLRREASAATDKEIQKDRLDAAQSLLNSLVRKYKEQGQAVPQNIQALDQSTFQQNLTLAQQELNKLATDKNLIETELTKLKTDQEKLHQDIYNWEKDTRDILDEKIKKQTQINKLVESQMALVRKMNEAAKEAQELQKNQIEQQQESSAKALEKANSIGASAGSLQEDNFGGIAGNYNAESPVKGSLKVMMEDFRKMLKDPNASEKDLTEALNKIKEVLDQFNALPLVGQMRNDIANGMSEKDLEQKYKEQLDQVTGGFGNMEKYIEQVKTYTRMQEDFQILEASIIKSKELEKEIRTSEMELLKLTNNLKRTENELRDTGNISIKTTTDRLAELNAEVVRLKNSAMQNAGQASSVLNAIMPGSGNFPGYANGGLLTGPPGVDNQLIWAHAGEYVVNSDATKQFYSNLVAMNHGYQPKGFAQGGPITQIGDINISVSTTGEASSQTAVRDIGQSLQRAIRLGSLGKRG